MTKLTLQPALQVMTLQGIVKGYHGLIATRVMLGVAEAGFFPAASYLVTTWYCRFEVQRRLSVFYSASALAGAFSGILAYGIQHMDGAGGLEGWRWIFILEGLLTVAIGSTLHWTLPDSPETATFLQPWEREVLVRRLAEDAGTADGHVEMHDSFQWSSLKGPLTEWKLYLCIFIWWGNAIPVYGFTYTVPAIIVGLGYTSAVSQLLTVPLYISGVISIISLSWLADKKQVRWKFVTYPYLVAAAGFLALLAIPHPK
ncbi:hypothetical protein LTR37_000233 [Vermiconidia calcicola]|uniref:Uncharacterized protein n=1 Tax=Vermiconidia calcicola TaxID=1690605 RepID=A0ACC3NZ90_9PEZI|nr:hypothetical protein LTR37_000233 [Vermiconidia calcicola]